MSLGLHMGLTGGTGGAAGSSSPLYGMWADGTDDHVELISTGWPLLATDPFALEVQFQTTGTGEAVIGDSQATGSFRGCLLNVNASGFLQWQMGHTVADRLATRTNATYNTGSNVEARIEYDGSKTGAGVVIKIGGVAVATTVVNSTLTDSDIDSGLPLNAFARGDDSLRFGGRVGEIKLYDNNTGGNLIRYWEGDGNTNANWEDQAGSDNGTVSGSPSRAISTDGGATWSEET